MKADGVAVGKSGGKRKEKQKSKPTKKYTPYVLLTLETLNVIVLPAEKSEKNEKLQQRSGEETVSHCLCRWKSYIRPNETAHMKTWRQGELTWEHHVQPQVRGWSI